MSQSIVTQYLKSLETTITEVVQSVNPYLQVKSPLESAIYLYTDSEWGKTYGKLGEEVITTIILALYLEKGKWNWKLFLVPNSYYIPTKNPDRKTPKVFLDESKVLDNVQKHEQFVNLNLQHFPQEKLEILPCPGQNGVIHEILDKLPPHQHLRTCHKYSHKDLSILFGRKQYMEWVNGHYIKQRRSISFMGEEVAQTFSNDYLYLSHTYNIENSEGVLEEVPVRLSMKNWDIQGLSKENLGSQAESVGLNATLKLIMEQYKTNMDQAWATSFTDFIVYAIHDVILTTQITYKYLDIYNKVIKDMLSGDKWLAGNTQIFNWDSIPKTTGSIVWNVFTSMLVNYTYVYKAVKDTPIDFTIQEAIGGVLSGDTKEDFTWTPENVQRITEDNPLTADLFNLALYRMMICKQNTMAPSVEKESKTAYEVINKVLKSAKTETELVQASIEIPINGKLKIVPLIKFFVNPHQPWKAPEFFKYLASHALSSANPGNWGIRDDDCKFNLKTQGGRIANNNPMDLISKVPGIDPDQASAYALIMNTLIYPIGLSTTFSKMSHESTRIPLSKIESLIEKGEITEETPFLMLIETSSDLNFDQDLLFSSVYTSKQIDKFKNAHGYFTNEEVDADEYGDNEKISSDYMLYRRQLINAPIDFKTFMALKNVCTTKEWADFKKKVYVKSCVVYKNSDRIDDPVLWAKTIFKHKGAYQQKLNRSKSDQESRKWLAFPMSLFIKPNLENKKKYKAEKKKATTTEAKLTWGALESAAKLLNNTLYGDMSSVYFDESNTIISNMITARVRLYQWKHSKSLMLAIDVTDGGLCYIHNIAHQASDSPQAGMNTLANQYVNPKTGLSQWLDPERVSAGVLTVAPLGYDYPDHKVFEDFCIKHNLPVPADNTALKPFWDFAFEKLDKNGTEKANIISSLHHKQLAYDKLPSDSELKQKVALLDEYSNDFHNLATLLMTYHSKLFWSNYGEDINEMDLKVEHTFMGSRISGKGDYSLETVIKKVKPLNDFSPNWQAGQTFLHVKRGVKTSKAQKFVTKHNAVIVIQETFGITITGESVELIPDNVFEAFEEEYNTYILGELKPYTVSKPVTKAEYDKKMQYFQDNAKLPLPYNDIDQEKFYVWSEVKKCLIEWDFDKGCFVEEQLSPNEVYMLPVGEFHTEMRDPRRFTNSYFPLNNQSEWEKRKKQLTRTKNPTKAEREAGITKVEKPPLYEKYKTPDQRIKQMAKESLVEAPKNPQ
jgi:hypothetical protein